MSTALGAEAQATELSFDAIKPEAESWVGSSACMGYQWP